MRALRSFVGILCICGLAGACGSRASSTDAGSDTRVPDSWTFDARQPDARRADGLGVDATPVDAGVVDSSPSCVAAIAALQAELYAKMGQACSVVVRLDYQTRAILGYQVFCGPYAATDEAAARATAQKDTGYGQSGKMLNPAPTEDAFVFYDAPSDFGGAAVVSKRSGLSVFGGSIVWLGTGEITYPKTWRPAQDLASGCPAVGAPRPLAGYDLATGSKATTAEIAAAHAEVAQTAVPAAFWGGGYLFDVVVLKYARGVGAFDPNTAEWIVIVNGGWLE